jgi:hypothetical protein
MLKNYVKFIVAILFVSNVMAQNIPSYVPKDGLVGWWPFNGNANDESGNGNHGTVNGATLTADRNGFSNKSYNFDGNSNYILIEDSPKLQLNEITISYWVKTGNTNPMYLICKQNINDASNSNYVVQFNPLPSGANTHRFHSSYNSCPNTSWKINDYKSTFTDNVWHNFISIVSLDSLKFYFDGNLIYASKNSSGEMTGCNGSELLFGRGWNNYPYYFKGQLDDISIYNRALSEQEVKQLYEGCNKETATSNSFNSYAFTNNSSINLTATPTGGTFSGNAVTNNAFYPSKGKLGKNQVKYTFKNSTGCADSTNFEMILVDTLGNKCTETIYDTILKINFKLTTGIKAGQLTSMNVYPNPTSDVVIIEANDVTALNGYSYKMVDLQGKQVYKELVTKSKTEISLKSIGAKGVYILHVVDAQGVSIENKKIVLE